jgi:hypothetical protein
VAIGRAVAAPCAAALLAGAKVHPLRADLHAVLALAADGKLYIIDRADVSACTGSSHFNHPDQLDLKSRRGKRDSHPCIALQ